jgi:hypothetical protein
LEGCGWYLSKKKKRVVDGYGAVMAVEAEAEAEEVGPGGGGR